MILLLDTSTPTCYVGLSNSEAFTESTWEAGRGLSKGLLAHLQEKLAERGVEWSDLAGVVVFKGPGSFTGLRIGVSVINALVDVRSLPVVGVTGDDWKQVGLARLEAGDDDKIVLPEYGADANITTPRK